jgi:hypothetical protein
MDERATSRENATSQQWEHPLDSLTELFFCSSKDIPNVAHHFWNVIKWYIVLFVVSFSRQLRYPRHIFWAAVSFFEMIYLVQSILEMIVILHRDYLACPPYVILASVDYSILLLCLSLAALDRYLAIARYECYKKKVTNRDVIVLISVTSALTFVIITSPFWTGYLSVYTFSINWAHMHWVLAWNLLLGLVCPVF